VRLPFTHWRHLTQRDKDVPGSQWGFDLLNERPFMNTSRTTPRSRAHRRRQNNTRLIMQRTGPLPGPLTTTGQPFAGQRPDRTLAIQELTVAANLFSEICGPAPCISASAGPAAPRSTASMDFQSLSFTSADSFSAASTALINLSGIIKSPNYT
jgi:hypothetical protein